MGRRAGSVQHKRRRSSRSCLSRAKHVDGLTRGRDICRTRTQQPMAASILLMRWLRRRGRLRIDDNISLAVGHQRQRLDRLLRLNLLEILNVVKERLLRQRQGGRLMVMLLLLLRLMKLLLSHRGQLSSLLQDGRHRLRRRFAFLARTSQPAAVVHVDVVVAAVGMIASIHGTDRQNRNSVGRLSCQRSRR